MEVSQSAVPQEQPSPGTLFGVIAPLLSLFIFSVGHGLLSTLIPLRLAEEQVSAQWIGFISTAYFSGLVIGAMVNSKLIMRVGHIRAYAAYASTLAGVGLLYGLYVQAASWLPLRLIGGFATGGLLVVIESWLMVSSTHASRGRIMALYMILFYSAMIVGQFLLKNMDIRQLIPFAWVALVGSLSVIPLAVTRVAAPHISGSTRLSLRQLFRLTPAGVVAGFGAGLVLGVIYGLLPAYCSDIGYSVEQTTNTMAIIILGGLVGQFPIGRFSDRYDRRMVLAVMFGLLLILSCIYIWFDAASDYHFTTVMIFMFGLISFALYPISLSHACDELTPEQMISGNEGLLLSYSLGAMAGPMIAPTFMAVRGPQGMFGFFALVCALTVVFLLYRRTVRKPVPIEDHVAFSVTTPNTPMMGDLDPRFDGYQEETEELPLEARHPLNDADAFDNEIYEAPTEEDSPETEHRMRDEENEMSSETGNEKKS